MSVSAVPGAPVVSPTPPSTGGISFELTRVKDNTKFLGKLDSFSLDYVKPVFRWIHPTLFLSTTMNEGRMQVGDRDVLAVEGHEAPDGSVISDPAQAVAQNANGVSVPLLAQTAGFQTLDLGLRFYNAAWRVSPLLGVMYEFPIGESTYAPRNVDATIQALSQQQVGDGGTKADLYEEGIRGSSLTVKREAAPRFELGVNFRPTDKTSVAVYGSYMKADVLYTGAGLLTHTDLNAPSSTNYEPLASFTDVSIPSLIPGLGVQGCLGVVCAGIEGSVAVPEDYTVGDAWKVFSGKGKDVAGDKPQITWNDGSSVRTNIVSAPFELRLKVGVQF